MKVGVAAIWNQSVFQPYPWGKSVLTENTNGLILWGEISNWIRAVFVLQNLNRNVLRQDSPVRQLVPILSQRVSFTVGKKTKILFRTENLF